MAFAKGYTPWNKGTKGMYGGWKSSKKSINATIERNKNRVYTPELRKKYSEVKRGERHWNWKGGVSDISKRIRQSVEYKLWREAVFKRDKYSCVWCGATCGNGKTIYLNADHIKPFCDYPELRFAIDNGRTLCIICHRKTETYKGRSNKGKKYKKRGIASEPVDNSEVQPQV